MSSSGAFRTQSPYVPGSNPSRGRCPDHGRQYQHRAITLIKLCQSISDGGIRNLRLYSALLDVQKQCDRAIAFAIDARKETTEEADNQFEIAIKDLKTYNQGLFNPTFNNTHMDTHMKDATKEDDKSPKHSILRNPLRKGGDNPRKNVEIKIHILNSLPDPSPTIVRQNLGSFLGSSLPAEIIWNFGHFGDGDKRRITLAQNPHFYKELHTSPSRYGVDFKSQPTFEYDGKKKAAIYVLTNNSHGVLLECVAKPVVLDNVWVTNHIIIARDTHGNLFGESIITKFIKATGLYWNCIESLEMPPTAKPINDWKEPILQLCGTSNTTDTHKLYALARAPMTLDMLG